MSETTIVSLLNKRDGRVISSIVPMKNGKWLEIKKNFEFQSIKQVFDTEESWLSERNPEGWYEIERNRREPRMTQEEKWEEHRIPSAWKDVHFLREVQDKYSIQFREPRIKTDLIADRDLFRTVIACAEARLQMNYPDEKKAEFQQTLETERKRLCEVEAKMKQLGDPALYQGFYPLTKQMTLAYVEATNKLLPISLCKVNDNWKIVYEGKSAETFAELNLPDRPTLWVKMRGNKFFRVY